MLEFAPLKTEYDLEIAEGVWRSRDSALSSQEKIYLQVRMKESRILTDSQVRALPKSDRNSPHRDEWKIRLSGFNHLARYLKKRRPAWLLDIGCGNGWMVNKLQQSLGCRAIGMDLNWKELTQASRIFSTNSKLEWYYCDAVRCELPMEVDTIIVASAIQYFSNITLLIAQLRDWLSPQGELHILDSFVYTPQGRNQARERSITYYQDLDLPEMAAHYHHHLESTLLDDGAELMYNPDTPIHQLSRRLSWGSPFPWYRFSSEK